MKGMLKIAAVVALLGLVGLFCVGVLAMFVAGPVVAPYDTLGQTTGAAHQPIAPEVLTWSTVIGQFVKVTLFWGTILVLLLVAYRVMRRRPEAGPEESETLYELSRRAKDLTRRMEALETLITDEPARHHNPEGPPS